MKYCIECKKIISKKIYIRCKQCANKALAQKRYIPRPKCMDCNKQLKSLKAKRCYSCNNKIRWSKEYRQYMSNKHNGENNPMYGKKMLKHSERMKGKNNPSWKGGYYINLQRGIRGLSEYNNWRTKVFQRDNYTCQECNTTGYIEVHHIKEFKKLIEEFLYKYNQFSPIDDYYILIRLAITYQSFWDISNGKTLCKDCHNKIKGKI